MPATRKKRIVTRYDLLRARFGGRYRKVPGWRRRYGYWWRRRRGAGSRGGAGGYSGVPYNSTILGSTLPTFYMPGGSLRPIQQTRIPVTATSSEKPPAPQKPVPMEGVVEKGPPTYNERLNANIQNDRNRRHEAATASRDTLKRPGALEDYHAATGGAVNITTQGGQQARVVNHIANTHATHVNKPSPLDTMGDLSTAIDQARKDPIVYDVPEQHPDAMVIEPPRSLVHRRPVPQSDLVQQYFNQQGAGVVTPFFGAGNSIPPLPPPRGTFNFHPPRAGVPTSLPWNLPEQPTNLLPLNPRQRPPLLLEPPKNDVSSAPQPPPPLPGHRPPLLLEAPKYEAPPLPPPNSKFRGNSKVPRRPPKVAAPPTPSIPRPLPMNVGDIEVDTAPTTVATTTQQDMGGGAAPIAAAPTTAAFTTGVNQKTNWSKQPGNPKSGRDINSAKHDRQSYGRVKKVLTQDQIGGNRNVIMQEYERGNTAVTISDLKEHDTGGGAALLPPLTTSSGGGGGGGDGSGRPSNNFFNQLWNQHHPPRQLALQEEVTTAPQSTTAVAHIPTAPAPRQTISIPFQSSNPVVQTPTTVPSTEDNHQYTGALQTAPVNYQTGLPQQPPQEAPHLPQTLQALAHDAQTTAISTAQAQNAVQNWQANHPLDAQASAPGGPGKRQRLEPRGSKRQMTSVGMQSNHGPPKRHQMAPMVFY